MRYVKALGLAAALALALMAFVGAGSASAFTSAHCGSKGVVITEKCTLDAESTEAATFTTTAGTISCATTTAMASIKGTVTEIETESIAYDNCTFLGIFGVTVNMGTCQYNFHISGTVDITPAGCSITFSAVGCTVTVKSQNGLTAVGYENMAGPPKDVTILPNVTNIVYSTSSSCPGGAHTNETGGKYQKGKTTVRGTFPVGTFVDFTVV